jgi:mono/diheme cytochrome c family protein
VTHPFLTTLAFTFPLTPRWTGLAFTVYILTWVATFVASWNLASFLIGKLFFNPQTPAYQGVRAYLYAHSAKDRKLTFWGILVSLGLAAGLSLAAIEPGLWNGTFEPIDAVVPTLRALVIFAGLLILASIWAFTTPAKSNTSSSSNSSTSSTPDPGHETRDASASSPDPGILAFSTLAVLIGLDKTTGLGIANLDLSTGGVNESLMWLMLAIAITAAGQAGLAIHYTHAVRLARIALAAGGLALFFGTVTATIRTGQGVSQTMMLAITGLVFLGSCLMLILTMVHLAKAPVSGAKTEQTPSKLPAAGGLTASLLAAAIVAVGFLGRLELADAKASGTGQVIPNTSQIVDPLQIAPAVAQDYDKRELDMGKAVFIRNCANCHGIDLRIVGPPVTEIAELYRHEPDKLAAWTKKPGKRRPEYPAMPAVLLTEDRYQAVSKFMIALGRTELEKDAATNETKSQK